jgi:hypothetical protein
MRESSTKRKEKKRNKNAENKKLLRLLIREPTWKTEF